MIHKHRGEGNRKAEEGESKVLALKTRVGGPEPRDVGSHQKL